jgi:hypothetical protein
MIKTGTVRTALTELARLMTRRLDHVNELANCDVRIESLRSQIAEVLQVDPIPPPPIVGPIPHERAIKLALLPGPLSAATVSRRIRQPEETVRRSLRLIAQSGRVQHIGNQRGRNSRWQLTGTMPHAPAAAGAQA